MRRADPDPVLPRMFGNGAGAVRQLLAVSLLALACSLAGPASGDQGEPIRVCADPDNLPYSNHDLQGFENKIAELVAKDLGEELSYFWWPHQRGLVRNTLQRDECDVLLAIPTGFDPVLWTKPYYRSTYVLVYRSDRKLSLKSLDDPALKGLKIGVFVNTPPYDALANRDLAANMVPYRLFFDPQDLDPADRPQRLLEDVVSGVTDVAAAWGPLAGYFVKHHPGNLEVVPIDDDANIAMSYEFSMGVRKGKRELKARLEGTLDRHEDDIRRILEEYGVPLLPLKPRSGAPEEKRPPPPGSHTHESTNQ